MGQLTSKINILVMPTDICNMDCIYCFHNSHHERKGKMNLHTLERLYQITLNTYSAVTFIWHGGEPLIMGLDFYKEAIRMQKRYLNTDIRNRMQSNLTLLTDEMAEFFVEEHIGIGSSFDGLQNEQLRGNTEAILCGRDRLIKNGGTCGFILVISKKNIDYLIENYDFMKAKCINYTLNLYVSNQTPNDIILGLEPEHTIKKIIDFYGYWLHDYECNIHIDYFERFIKFILYNKKGVCKYNSCLGKWIGIRYNGEIVPCNRFFPKEYSYGNVWDYTNLDNAFESEGFIFLLSQAIERRKKCQSCSVYSLCEGGCNNVAYNENGISNNGGASCVILQRVFKHIVKSISDLQYTNIYPKQYNPVVLELLHKK